MTPEQAIEHLEQMQMNGTCDKNALFEIAVLILSLKEEKDRFWKAYTDELKKRPGFGPPNPPRPQKTSLVQNSDYTWPRE